MYQSIKNVFYSLKKKMFGKEPDKRIFRTKEGLEFKVFYNWQPCSEHRTCEKRKEMIEEGRFNQKTDCRFNGKMYKCEYYQKYNKEKEYTLDQI